MKKFIKALAVILCLSMIAPTVSITITETVEAATKPKIKLNCTQKTIYEGETFKLKITGTKKKVKWSSSNKKIATVSSKGVVTGIDGGDDKRTCKIYATVDKKKYTCKVTICGGVNIVCIDSAIFEDDSDPIICEGQTVRLKLTNPNAKPIWTSSNPEAISVTEDGLVKGINGGENKGDSKKCTITATVGKKSYTYDITVKASYISATEITIPADIGVVELRIENLYNYKITWTSTDENIVPINDKHTNILSFWFKTPGTATVTATTENNKTFQCVFTITPNMYQ